MAVTTLVARANVGAPQAGAAARAAAARGVQDLDTHEGNEYPVLALPDTVVFPNLVTPLFLGRDRTVAGRRGGRGNG